MWEETEGRAQVLTGQKGPREIAFELKPAGRVEDSRFCLEVDGVGAELHAREKVNNWKV